MSQVKKGPSNRKIAGFFSAAVIASAMNGPNTLPGNNIDKMIGYFNDTHKECMSVLYGLAEDMGYFPNNFDRALLTAEIRLVCALK